MEPVYRTVCKKCYTCLFFLPVMLLSVLFSGYANAYGNTIMDDIDILMIKDMTLRQEKNDFFLDVVFAVRNRGNTVRFQQSRFDISFVQEDSKEIPLGTTAKEDLLLSAETDDPTDVRFTAAIGDIESLRLHLISSDEMSELMMASNPKVNMHIRGGFDLKLRAGQGWMSQPGYRIDWILPLEIPREIFVQTYKAIEDAADRKEDPSIQRKGDWLDDTAFETEEKPVRLEKDSNSVE